MEDLRYTLESNNKGTVRPVIGQVMQVLMQNINIQIQIIIIIIITA